MSNIDKEWLQQTIAEMEEHRDLFPGDLDDNHGKVLAALRIALASLEAEAVYQVYGNNDDTWSDVDEEEMIRLRSDGEDTRTLYTAPPAPANAEPVAWLWSHRKHPSEVTLVSPEDDERAEGANWSGWSCQALYAAPPAPVSDEDKVLAEQARAVIHCLDMCGVPSGGYADNEQLQLWGRVIEYGRHPAPVSVPDVHHSVIAEQLAHVLSSMDATDHQRAVIGCAVDRLNKVSQLLQASHSAILVPEMLDYQGAKELYNYLMTEEETNATVNGWSACRAAMLQGADGTFTNEGTRNHPEDKLNMVDHSGDANEKGNSPLIPDGWVACSERMPEDRESVLLWDIDLDDACSGHYSHQTGNFYQAGMIIDNEITHWMPLPAAPQQEV